MSSFDIGTIICRVQSSLYVKTTRYVTEIKPCLLIAIGDQSAVTVCTRYNFWTILSLLIIIETFPQPFCATWGK
jgi:hypothetical protein